jgi:hypothetical protein
MKKKDSTLLGTVPNPNRKIIERGQVDTPMYNVPDYIHLYNNDVRL